MFLFRTIILLLFPIILPGCSIVSDNFRPQERKVAGKGIISSREKFNQSKSFEFEVNRRQIEILTQRRDEVSLWVAECGPESGFEGQVSDSFESCQQGDVVKWAGLTCLASELADDHGNKTKRCRDVSLAQGVTEDGGEESL